MKQIATAIRDTTISEELASIFRSVWDLGNTLYEMRIELTTGRCNNTRHPL